jgi:hypothetical protein
MSMSTLLQFRIKIRKSMNRKRIRKVVHVIQFYALIVTSSSKTQNTVLLGLLWLCSSFCPCYCKAVNTTASSDNSSPLLLSDYIEQPTIMIKQTSKGAFVRFVKCLS